MLYQIIKMGLLFAHLLFAYNASASHPKKLIPPHCPSVTAIMTTPFNGIEKSDHPGVWTVLQNHQKYDTEREWNFALMLEADNQQQAFKKAKHIISTIQSTQGPVSVNSIWFCDYKTTPALSAVAMSKTSLK